MDFSMFLFVLAGSLVIVINLFAIFWFGGMLLPLIGGGGPYVPSNDQRVKKMIDLASITNDDTVMDLGSGDGKLMIAALDAGAGHAIGYEIHPGLVKLSQTKLARKGYAGQSTVFRKSMWGADLSKTTLVLLYQIPYAMEKLGNKLKQELPTGARIVSNAFEIPGWEPVKTEEGVHVYVK